MEIRKVITKDFVDKWVAEMEASGQDANPFSNPAMAREITEIVNAIRESKLDEILHRMIERTVMPGMIVDIEESGTPESSIRVTALWGIFLGLRLAQRVIDNGDTPSASELERLYGDQEGN